MSAPISNVEQAMNATCLVADNIKSLLNKVVDFAPES
jgi:hypothetical protein